MCILHVCVYLWCEWDGGVNYARAYRPCTGERACNIHVMYTAKLVKQYFLPYWKFEGKGSEATERLWTLASS